MVLRTDVCSTTNLGFFLVGRGSIAGSSRQAQ